ncbi:hypothetical protein ES703_84670 [subsurface metagenome]
MRCVNHLISGRSRLSRWLRLNWYPRRRDKDRLRHRWLSCRKSRNHPREESLREELLS